MKATIGKNRTFLTARESAAQAKRDARFYAEQDAKAERELAQKQHYAQRLVNLLTTHS